ncbi:hypothetical protein TNCV_856611 [Trichonephila clavipes]|nr:hypothetical protein TNCV_856611 [Trichonephila clavipes]
MKLYEVVADDSNLEPLESEILDLEENCEDNQWLYAKVRGIVLIVFKRHNSLLYRNFERNVDSQRSPGSKTLPNMEPRITPTLNVSSECLKQTIPSCVESFENGEEFVGYSKGHSTMLLSTALVYCQDSLGEVFPLRALLDAGSQINLITHEAALALG